MCLGTFVVCHALVCPVGGKSNAEMSHPRPCPLGVLVDQHRGWLAQNVPPCPEPFETTVGDPLPGGGGLAAAQRKGG